jgi:hypothetical protein
LKQIAPATVRVAFIYNPDNTGQLPATSAGDGTYEKGIKVSDAEMKTLDIQGDEFHPEWNYTIRPRSAAIRSG